MAPEFSRNGFRASVPGNHHQSTKLTPFSNPIDRPETDRHTEENDGGTKGQQKKTALMDEKKLQFFGSLRSFDSVGNHHR